jgi:catechol 2,3-dioxygenase-like lactoylglutathione lyase family enzyme
MKISAIDHIVLTVRDIDATTAFYTKVLGMEAITFGRDRRALAFGAQKINLHRVGAELDPEAAHPLPGSADLCFVTTDAPSSVIEHLESCDVEVEDGPVERSGARGPIISVYCRDPDGNLLEVSSYPSAQQSHQRGQV